MNNLIPFQNKRIKSEVLVFSEKITLEFLIILRFEISFFNLRFLRSYGCETNKQ